ncbi:hypothetical protein H9P43_000868 [Blastocladiella emersonii ATCC 22665]|nr:hypothetical protein H9P43_000868 [Blastocladiella emersonii ATCC 22665]
MTNETSEQYAKHAAASPSADQVGWMFVREYYQIMNSEPSRLHCFYSRDSTAVHGLEATMAAANKGQHEIQKMFQTIGFKDCRVVISNVDSVPSLADGIIVQVIGEMSNAGAPSQKFVQTFFLAKQPKGYYILNDVFRFMREELESDTEDAETSPIAPTPAPVSKPATISTPPAAAAAAPAPAPAAAEQKRAPSPVAPAKAKSPERPKSPVATKPAPTPAAATPAPEAETPKAAAAPAPKSRETSPKRPASPPAKAAPAPEAAAPAPKETPAPRAQQQGKRPASPAAKSAAAAAAAASPASSPSPTAAAPAPAAAAPARPMSWATLAATTASSAPAPTPVHANKAAPSTAPTSVSPAPAAAAASGPIPPPNHRTAPPPSATPGITHADMQAHAQQAQVQAYAAQVGSSRLPLDTSVWVRFPNPTGEKLTEQQLRGAFPGAKIVAAEISKAGAAVYLESAAAARNFLGQRGTLGNVTLHTEERKPPGAIRGGRGGGRGGQGRGGRGGAGRGAYGPRS